MTSREEIIMTFGSYMVRDISEMMEERSKTINDIMKLINKSTSFHTYTFKHDGIYRFYASTVGVCGLTDIGCRGIKWYKSK